MRRSGDGSLVMVLDLHMAGHGSSDQQLETHAGHVSMHAENSRRTMEEEGL